MRFAYAIVIAAALDKEGYDGCVFVLKPQAGGREQLARLCDEVHQVP